MPDRDARYNRDDEQKPGRPPRTATEPPAARRSSQTDKTLTDPASGEPTPGRQRPNQARSDETEEHRR